LLAVATANPVNSMDFGNPNSPCAARFCFAGERQGGLLPWLRPGLAALGCSCEPVCGNILSIANSCFGNPG
jgi:hypothetical protein